MDRPAPAACVAALILLLAPVSGCSIKRFAIGKVADALVAGGDVYASDEDPELVRHAIPFALKTIEGLLAELPDHRGLLLAACRGFTQYSYAFVETDADLIESVDWDAAEQLRERALRLYLRARGYCLRALELGHPGIEQRLILEPEAAVTDTRERELELLYWTGAAWGSAISVGSDRPEIIADLPAVIALMRRGLELGEGFDGGAIHEVMITLESLPANMGGSIDRARRHFDRAVELSGGLRASPYVTLAVNVSVTEQKREEFERLLGQALAVDPDDEPEVRLHTLIVQKRARHLLEHVEDLFLPDFGDEDEENIP